MVSSLTNGVPFQNTFIRQMQNKEILHVHVVEKEIGQMVVQMVRVETAFLWRPFVYIPIHKNTYIGVPVVSPHFPILLPNLQVGTIDCSIRL